MMIKGAGIDESANLAVASVTETSFRPNQNKFGTKTQESFQQKSSNASTAGGTTTTYSIRTTNSSKKLTAPGI